MAHRLPLGLLIISHSLKLAVSGTQVTIRAPMTLCSWHSFQSTEDPLSFGRSVGEPNQQSTHSWSSNLTGFLKVLPRTSTFSPWPLTSPNAVIDFVIGCLLSTARNFHARVDVLQLYPTFSSTSPINPITPPVWRTPDCAPIKPVLPLCVAGTSLSCAIHPSSKSLGIFTMRSAFSRY